MIPQDLKNELNTLSDFGPNFKPHKYLALLAAINYYKNHKNRRIYYDEEFKNLFNEYFQKYSSQNDRNRPYTPFFHLGNTSFWHLVATSGKQKDLLTKTSIGGPTDLSELVNYAELDSEFCKLLDNERNYELIESLLIFCLKNGRKYPISEDQFLNIEEKQVVFERLNDSFGNINITNRFVSYLNTLHCEQASSENAMAEFQACNPFFSEIFINHPLTTAIRDSLFTHKKTHVILTGHAGDGKSTIALELFKDLKKLSVDKPLSVPLKPREDITLPNGITVSIIKDLSEWSDGDKPKLLSDLFNGNSRFLLVSNTGTLLNTFADYGREHLHKSKAETEPLLLKAIDSTEPYKLDYGQNQFHVFNLALQDNLLIANNIFIRMLESDKWTECDNRECNAQCPVYRNISLIRQYRNRILDRLFMAYRRMYEYGTRLTLRQLTAHLAFIITAGLNCKDVYALSKRPDKPLVSEFMFYNRFFGDNGKYPDLSALQLQAIEKIREQGFGEQPCSTWERRLWLLTSTQSFKIGIPSLEEEFDRLRRYGSGEWAIEDESLSADEAREQVRRMLFFLVDFPNQDDSFIRYFLNSPSIMKWWKWQEDNFKLSLTERNNFKQRVFQVLQEQFTGIRLPENLASGQTLFITLSRHKQEIRQSAQIVLAQIDFENDFSLELNTKTTTLNVKRRDLCLNGNGKYHEVVMPLTLPFLDYVLMRQQGETGEVLQAAYGVRLEWLKSKLVNLAKATRDEDILLVRLRTNHTFQRQTYGIRNNKLEVV